MIAIITFCAISLAFTLLALICSRKYLKTRKKEIRELGKFEIIVSFISLLIALIFYYFYITTINLLILAITIMLVVTLINFLTAFDFETIELFRGLGLLAYCVLGFIICFICVWPWTNHFTPSSEADYTYEITETSKQVEIVQIVGEITYREYTAYGKSAFYIVDSGATESGQKLFFYYKNFLGLKDSLVLSDSQFKLTIIPEDETPYFVKKKYKYSYKALDDPYFNHHDSSVVYDVYLRESDIERCDKNNKTIT